MASAKQVIDVTKTLNEIEYDQHNLAREAIEKITAIINKYQLTTPQCEQCKEMIHNLQKSRKYYTVVVRERLFNLDLRLSEQIKRNNSEDTDEDTNYNSQSELTKSV